MYDENAENVAVDHRMVLMQQFVDLDSACKQLDRERKFLEEKSQKVVAEFREVTNRLRDTLAFDGPLADADRSPDAEVAKLR